MKPPGDTPSTGVTMMQQWVEMVQQGRRFRLRRPIDLRITQEEHLWTVRSDAVEAIGYGDTYQVAMDAFQSDFGDCWDRLVMKPHHTLDEHSQQMRERLLEVVDGVDYLE